jgi:hypothetical protein
MAKGARGVTLFGSNSCLVLPELGANQWSRKIIEAAVNAKNMTRPVVTPAAEVATPWRAGCPERGTSGSEGGVGKHSSAVRPAPTLLTKALRERTPLPRYILHTWRREPGLRGSDRIRW